MAVALKFIRFAAITFTLALTLPTLSSAQQINPTAEAVRESQLLEETTLISGECQLLDQKACTLEQLHGREWSSLNETAMRWIGGGAILALLAIVTAIYLLRGRDHIEDGRSGRLMAAFSAFERFVHWLAAVCFFVLTLTGLNMTFGKVLLLPLIGPRAFSTISLWGMHAHNYVSVPFTISVLIMIPLWIRWNIPNRIDIEWALEGGGFIGKKQPASDRFNAGQKAIYWVVVLGGLIAAATGYLLFFPRGLNVLVAMQLAQLVHGLVGLLYIAAMVFHVYMATIGEEGAFESMWGGLVDENWAKQYHSVWYKREIARGKMASTGPDNKPQPAS